MHGNSLFTNKTGNSPMICYSESAWDILGYRATGRGNLYVMFSEHLFFCFLLIMLFGSVLYIGGLYNTQEGYIASIEPAHSHGMLGAIDVNSH